MAEGDEGASTGLSYRDAGVDLDAAARAKDRLKEIVESTRDEHTLSEMGHFGGLYSVPADVPDPVLVSSADGVGTKLKIAFLTGRHDSVGQDLVNHCVNDILVQGAKPLFFLDYLACGAMDEEIVREVVGGVAVACRANGCALLGGETAQMSDFYQQGEYDLAGFVVGIVPRSQIIDGSRIQLGDTLIGVASAGLHTNGYTLAREIVFGSMGLGVDDPMPGTTQTVGSALLEIHRSYLRSVGALLLRGEVRGLAHVTGGGIPGNLPRVLPRGLGAEIERGSWTVPSVFQTLALGGSVSQTEMDRVFNMGVGMIVVAAPETTGAIVRQLCDDGENAWVLGRTVEGEGVEFVG